MRVRYINHSGFQVDIDNTVLIFDYYDTTGRLRVYDGDINNKNIYIFVTHNHPDHYDRRIFELANNKNVKYIVSDDVRPLVNNNVTYVTYGKTYEVDALKIKTLRSTDEGVAFVVEAKGKVIYHAGDLNYWYWNGESSEYNSQMGIDYKREINSISDMKIDLAFIPLDGRLLDKYSYGIDYAMKTLNIDRVFPMHFWGDFMLSERLRGEDFARDYKDKIMKLDNINQVFNL